MTQEQDSFVSVASNCCNWGRVNITLRLYAVGSIDCNGFLSKYTVFSSLNPVILSNSANEDKRLSFAHNSSNATKRSRFSKTDILLLLISNTFNFKLFSMPSIFSIPLWDM
eukprot:NODE_268_length_12243_cov_0.338109.p6 type:complete len:111 gc:universal NODE_268_length_12243_cov_0.338109:2060-1728(-)